MLDIRTTASGVEFKVRVVPRASKTEVFGPHDGVLKIRLKAPPVDGAANEELVKFLAKVLGVSRSNIEIISGQTSRTKRLRITGITAADLENIIGNKDDAVCR